MCRRVLTIQARRKHYELQIIEMSKFQNDGDSDLDEISISDVPSVVNVKSRKTVKKTESVDRIDK